MCGRYRKTTREEELAYSDVYKSSNLLASTPSSLKNSSKAPRFQTSLSDDYLDSGFDEGGSQLRRGLSAGDENINLVKRDDVRKDRAT